MMVRILFLDFDGVLHATHGRGEIMREFVWLPILKDLVSGFCDVRFVVHASARRNSDASFLGNRLRLDHNLYWGVTHPRLERWVSIQDWVAQRTDVSSFRILDDQASEFPDPPPSELILCHSQKGVSEMRVQEALRMWLSQTR